MTTPELQAAFSGVRAHAALVSGRWPAGPGRMPSAAPGLVLGIIVARLLVRAVTLTPAAKPPVPPLVTMYDLPQTLPLAALVAVVPALLILLRPGLAAELRAAEAV